ncbi:MAG: T9SS type A sorting domain-containing protein [Vicingaceae bacterium]
MQLKVDTHSLQKPIISFFQLTLLSSCILFTLAVNAQWTQVGNDIDGEAPLDRSGCAVSMPDSNTVAIGAYNNDGSKGHVRVYSRISSTWIQKGNDIDGEVIGDWSGRSVSMPDANTLAIGAPWNQGNGQKSGHVRIYRWSGAAWTQKGNDIDGEAAYDESGRSVSMPDTNTVAIGAPYNNGNGNHAGHVRIYEWIGNTWIKKGGDIDGEAADDLSGFSVSMPDANTIAIGALQNDGNGANAGHVRIYQWLGASWVQKGSDIDGEAAGDRSGTSVSMPDANTVAIGAPNNYGNGTDAGHVRVYQWSGSAWVQKGIDIDGNIENRSGIVSMPYKNVVAIGAPYGSANGHGIWSGQVRIYSFNTITRVNETESIVNGLKLYPNPTKDNFRLELNQLSEKNLLQVFDLQGKLIHQQDVSRLIKKINTQNWKAGVYFVRYGEHMKKLVILE